MEIILLFIVAIAPPLGFMYFIYWMDRHEPESMRTIMAAMAVGALSTVPAIIIQLAFENMALFQISGLTGAFFESFLLVAPSEELFKFLFIYLYLRNKHFYNEINDGIVFYGAGALGFALFENIFYVLDYGFSTGVLRAFTSIPIHTFCGIIVGYHAGLARFSGQAKPKALIMRGLLIAYLIHALYNTLVSAESLLALLFIPLMFGVYFFGYKLLHRGRKISIAASYEQREPIHGSPPGTEPFIVASATTNSHKPQASAPQNGEVPTDSIDAHVISAKKETWKAVLGRIILAMTILLWFLALLGTYAGSNASEIWDIFIGLIIITFIPFTIGFLLELSYRRGKKEANK
jgi:protease PrsW